MNMMRQLKDFYEEMRGCLAKAPLFVLYLDGLGYYMYEHALRNGKISDLKERYQVEPVQTVAPPVTNAAMATILTGCLPRQHEICSRKEHVPKVPTIFREWGHRAVCLEGDSVIVQTEILPRLHTARSGKTADEWIFRSALKEIEKGAYFIFAHFHGIDDAAHLWGPYAEETLEEIEKKDRIAGMIAERFRGQVLLISDHGLHEENGAGNHGGICREDLTAIWGKKR